MDALVTQPRNDVDRHDNKDRREQPGSYLLETRLVQPE